MEPADTPAPLVSVITATFRALPALERTVASVAAQDFGSVEHVVVDGGSDDGTREFLASRGDRVRWVSEVDHGIADALNKGVRMARGEWIIVLQAGDTFVDEGSLGMAVRHLDESAMVGFGVLSRLADGSRRLLKARPFSVLTELRVVNPHQGLFCRRAVFERIGLFDEAIPIGMDYDHLLRAKRAGFDLKVRPEVVAVMPADGISSQDDWPSRLQRLREQFHIQWKNANHLGHRLGLLAFWSVFYPTYIIKNLVAPDVRIF